MKKFILLLLVVISFSLKAQITDTKEISDIIVSDTSFYFEKAQTNYSYSLGACVHFVNVVGTGGTFYFLNSPVDSLIIASGIGFTVNSDTSFAIIDDVTPFEYVGYKYIKGSTTSGQMTFYLSRKTRK